MLNSFTDRRMLFLAFVLSCLFSVVCIAAPGDLDPSFGSGGVATDYIGAEITIRGVAIQSDGKIVVIGTRKLADSQFLPPKDRLFIRRYTSTGALYHNQSFPTPESNLYLFRESLGVSIMTFSSSPSKGPNS